MTSAQEDRAEGWRKDVAARNGDIASLAASLRHYREQDASLRALVVSWKVRADECCSVAVADELRGCAAGVDAAMGETNG